MNLSQVAIIESTLREGEQFAGAFFTSEQKYEIARMLDEFGVDCLELTSPAASPQSYKDAQTIARMGLRAKILTHTRCHMDDAMQAVETGVDGLDLVFGTSSVLRAFSHGKSITQIIDTAEKVIGYVRSQGVEVRFSSEDSFRSDLVDLLTVYKAVSRMGVNRVGIADTLGGATPRQVFEVVKTVRGIVDCDIEFHGHDDTGCAIANSLAAIEGGATHIDTCVLGIGERNGITPLGGLIARLYSLDREGMAARYNLPMLRSIENYVADLVGIQVPFNNYITGFAAFTHKAGIHAKAILNDPSTYEILNPADFGLSRYIHIGHRLTGWNAVKNRVEQLGLNLSDDEIKEITRHIKACADHKPLALADVDALLRHWNTPNGVRHHTAAEVVNAAT